MARAAFSPTAAADVTEIAAHTAADNAKAGAALMARFRKLAAALARSAWPRPAHQGRFGRREADAALSRSAGLVAL